MSWKQSVSWETAVAGGRRLLRASRAGVCSAVLLAGLALPALAAWRQEALSTSSPAAQDGLLPLASRITDVVVFPSHAQLTRTLHVEALAGENRVLFGDLVPGLDPQTVRASVGPGARIIGTEIRTLHLEQAGNAALAALDARLQELDDALALRAGEAARVQEGAAFYRAVKERLGHDLEQGLQAGSVAVAAWSDVLQFVQTGLAESDASLAATALAVRELQAQRDAVAAERKDHANQQPHEDKQVLVSFTAERAGPLDVGLHYLVGSVAWKPSYDVHLDRSAGEIEIIGYGQVMQWTGEPWEDVHLTLAMSRPDLDLALPELAPLEASLDEQAMAVLAKEVGFLGRAEANSARKWAEGRFVRRQDRETFRRNLEQLARQSREDLAALGLSHELVAGALARLVDRFAGVRYEVAQRASVPLDKSPHKVVTFSARVPARLRYVATPALGDTVMLQGVASNLTGHTLLEGSASLFVDGSYVGASVLPGAAQNEELSLAFGPDDALVVERQLLAREVQGPEAFRQSQVLTYRYGIRVRNYNELPVEVDVVDQLPISKTEEIRVAFLEASAPPAIDAETGVLRWTLQVAPGATQPLEHAFTVECPVGREVHWR